MAFFVAAIIILLGIVVSVVAIILGVKKNWMLPKAERQRSANKFVIAGAVLFVLLKIGDTYTAHENREAETKRASETFAQAITFMSQMPELRECKNKLESGEFKSHVVAYTNCQETFVITAYRKAGVWNQDTLRALSHQWQDMAAKADRGEEISKEDFGASIMNILIHDGLGR